MEELWKQILAELEIEISKPIFHTFFKNTRLIDFSDSIATIGTSTPITSEYIEKRYYALIKKILDKKTGANVSIVFVSSVAAQTQKETAGAKVKQPHTTWGRGNGATGEEEARTWANC